ncbi:MAG: penicillin acylase family protein [Acidimicrobiia bacterium]|nr:penicillin acylase family protein [Acidimicrobiia bacterium]
MTNPLARRRSTRTLVALAAVALLAAACTTDDGGATDDTADGPDGTTGTQPTSDVTELGEGDTYEATIRRDSDGVPHIVAADEASLAFGQGWASAEDRSCDLADQVVKIRGERASVLGAGEDDEHITSDLAWRTIGIFDIASDDWEDASDDVRQLFEAYTDGWNGHLEAVGADGIEGWCAGADWVRPVEPVEVYAYSRAIALQASSAQLTGFLGAQPPEVTDDDADADTDGDGEQAAGLTLDAPVASNGWAVGAERSADGGGMLVANPHFPWEGELRFWEVHLTVPGEIDIYGAQLSGLPGIGIGFTETFGWTHTVSAGTRFTAYRLNLIPGDPTSYRYLDEERPMESRDITISVLDDDGTLDEVTETAWYSHYGPIIDFPGFGWTEEATISFRDANIDNDEFAEQYLAMMRAGDLDEFIAAHEEYNGVPLFNTVATSADGRAWYADTSATPNLSPAAIEAYERSIEEDPIVAIAAESRAILLNGSDPLFEWVEDPDARDPGLVPFADQPQLLRDDYVFNANDSFWMAHATEMIEGDYSPLHGAQRTARSPRTRENAVLLDEVGADAASGPDGLFTLQSLADAALANTGFTSRVLRADVVQRCEAEPVGSTEAVTSPDGDELAPAGTVDLSEACEVLDAWDGTYDLDSRGAVLWREFISGFDTSDLASPGELWATAFDPNDPVGTPGGLAPPLDGNRTPVLDRLARAVTILEVAEIDLDAPLGDVQFALRGDTVVPIHGGDGRDGVANIVGYGGGGSTLEDIPTRGDRIVDGSSLATTDGTTGYLINNGTSFLLALAYTDDGPEALVLHTYGNTQDRTSEAFVAGTERFSNKDWRSVRFTEDDVTADPGLTETIVRG